MSIIRILFAYYVSLTYKKVKEKALRHEYHDLYGLYFTGADLSCDA